MSHRTYALHGLAAVALALSLGACSDITTSTTSTLPDRELLAASGPSLSWNQTARELIASRAVGVPPTQARILAYLSVDASPTLCALSVRRSPRPVHRAVTAGSCMKDR